MVTSTAVMIDYYLTGHSEKWVMNPNREKDTGLEKKIHDITWPLSQMFLDTVCATERNGVEARGGTDPYVITQDSTNISL